MPLTEEEVRALRADRATGRPPVSRTSPPAGFPVQTGDIADSAITNAKVSATAAIAYSKLALSNSIVAGDITADAVTGSKIAGNARSSLIAGACGTGGNSVLGVGAAGCYVHPMTTYEGTAGSFTPPTTDTIATRLYVPSAGAIRNLRVVHLSEGAAGDLAVTIYKNGVATTLSVTCTSTGALFSDNDEVAVAAGDYLQIFLDHTGAGTVNNAVTWSFEYEEAA